MRVRHKHLEDMEALVLHHLAVVSEQVHADFEVLASVDVGDHDAVVGAVEENFAEQFDGLAFGDVAVGLDENIVVFFEEEIEVDGEVAGDEILVAG